MLGARLTGEGDVGAAPYDEAIQLLRIERANVEALEPSIRAHWISVLVQLQADAGRADAADATLSEFPTEWLDGPTRFLLRGEIHNAAGRKDAAQAAAKAGASGVDAATHPTTLRQLALLAELLEDYRTAGSLW